MKIIVPCNNKGGVGKTCITAILSDYFSKVLKKRTLVIDLDPQCNISQRFLQMEIDPNNPEGHRPSVHPDYKDSDEDWDGRSSISDIFLRPEVGVVPYPTMNENLDVMPAHASDLLAVEQCNKDEVLEKIYNRFNTFLMMPDVQAEYDYVIVDSAPCLLVSDTFEISDYVDCTLYVVRSGYTDKNIADFINENKRLNRLKDINIILNSIGNSSSYGYKYGYQYGYKYGYKYGYNYGYGYGYGFEEDK